MFETGRSKIIQENRKRITPIIETILLCARQNISLRGHNDSGPLNLTEPLENDGIFNVYVNTTNN